MNNLRIASKLLRIAKSLMSKDLYIRSTKLEERATANLGKKKKFRARNRGDIESAAESAAYYAKKYKEEMYIYPGNSYGMAVWRVSMKKSEYLNPINNTGERMYSITPDLKVYEHELAR